jgi:hypothetical protein
MYCKRLCFVAVVAVAVAAVQAGPVWAGDVTAALDESGLELSITGDQADNEIAVYSDEDGTLWVEGREGTTINGGAAPVPFTSPYSFAYFFKMTITMGDGDDAVDMRRGGVFCHTLRVVTGAGDDEVVLQGGSVRYLYVHTDNGNDEVLIEDLSPYEILVSSGDGQDEVVLRNTETGYDHRTYIHAGRGHDDIVVDSIVAFRLCLYAGAGNDLVELRGSSAVYFDFTGGFASHIDLGDGSDVLDADGSEGASMVVGCSLFIWGDESYVSGHKGHDTLINPDYFHVEEWGTLNIYNFEVIDY